MQWFAKYPKLAHLDRRPELFAVKQVVAVEKLHGTNFRVGIPAGASGVDAICFGGRNESFGTTGGADFYKGRPVRWFRERPELLDALVAHVRERGYGDVVIYGEICGAGIQRGVRYRTDHEVTFRAFDLAIGENLATEEAFLDLCESTALPRAPEVWRGEPSTEAFDALLERVSLEVPANTHNIRYLQTKRDKMGHMI